MKRLLLRLMVYCVCFCMVSPSLAADVQEKDGEASPQAQTAQPSLTQGSLSAFALPSVTIYGVADQPPSVPVTTNFGTQFNVVTEEQISRQGALDFYDALRNVPGVMFQKKNIIGGQTSHSLYMRGRGASHPGPDMNILFDDVPRSGVLYGQALADGIPTYALGGMEIYKYPQPSRFGSGYGMINFIPKYMTEEGTEFRVGFEGGSYGTMAQQVGAGAKVGIWDIYAVQSLIRTDGHVAHSQADQTSYYVNTGLQATENWSIRLMANYVDASTQAPHNPLTKVRAQPSRFDTETTLVTLTLANDYEIASGYIKGYYNNTNFSLVDESTGGGVGNAISKQSNDLYGLRARETFRLWEGSEIVTGFDLDKMDLENRQNRHDGGVNRVWDFPSVTVFSPYLAVSQRFGSEESFHFIPSAGIRYYSNSEFKNTASPQAGLILGYGRTNLHANYARGVNYPSPVVLQGMLPNTSLPPGFDTKKLKPEVVDHYEIGLTHAWEGLATVGATYFHDRGKDRIRAFMANGSPDESFFTSSTSRYKIHGFELTGSLTPVEGLEFFAGATWLDVKATGDDGIKRSKMPYTPNFSLQAGFKWNFYDNFTLSGDYQFLHNVYSATSMRTAPLNNPASNFAELTSIDKLRDISVANLRLDYAFDYEPWKIKEGKVFVSVDNVFDNKYAYTLAKDTTTNQRAFYTMPGITFMVGFDLKF